MSKTDDDGLVWFKPEDFVLHAIALRGRSVFLGYHKPTQQRYVIRETNGYHDRVPMGKTPYCVEVHGFLQLPYDTFAVEEYTELGHVQSLSAAVDPDSPTAAALARGFFRQIVQASCSLSQTKLPSPIDAILTRRGEILFSRTAMTYNTVKAERWLSDFQRYCPDNVRKLLPVLDAPLTVASSTDLLALLQHASIYPPVSPSEYNWLTDTQRRSLRAVLTAQCRSSCVLSAVPRHVLMDAILPYLPAELDDCKPLLPFASTAPALEQRLDEAAIKQKHSQRRPSWWHGGDPKDGAMKVKDEGSVWFSASGCIIL
eukprot:NODE_2315_length_1089_cov_17.292100_g2297_i0.p1 GENE.NODE_2315_length_1089_cov_17.292100_g2297_i0~~NODE_2315_length_1089_cov_17.292100_g2297_i0.p1  ORF type:complete len:314 (-),score=48.60 NODE_2315_length_1089_cov_17.292100_g2297_i0:78-1019(-)